MAEAILNFKGRPTFTAYSAGSHPAGMVRPEALREIERAHLPTKGLRSKDWDEFAQPGAPEMNHHGGGDPELQRPTDLHCLQRRQPPGRHGAARGAA